MNPKLAWLSIFAACLGGCAGPVGQPVTQTVRVETPGCPAASCTVSNDRGSWRVERTPSDVVLSSSTEPLKVVCRSEEGVQGAANEVASLSGTSGSGAVAGGLAGGAAVGMAVGSVAIALVPPLGVMLILAGAGLGAAAGSAVEHTQQTLSYPAVISVAMMCKSTDPPARPLQPAPRFGVSFRGMSVAESKALGLGERGAVLVTEVGAGSLAQVAGLRRGDVLLAVDGRELSEAGQLEALAAGLQPGSHLNLKVWRDGAEMSVTISLPATSP